MNKAIDFQNDDQHTDYCVGQTYYDFLDYAFAESDYFMLAYVNYYGKGYSHMMKYFKKALEPYKVKSRSNPSWPGTSWTYSRNTTYNIVFYKNEPEAKVILRQVSKMSDWTRPSYPQDLAFFKGNQCWFYSVGHEKIAAIIRATEKDLDFVESKKLASRENAYEVDDHCFDEYDEVIEKP